MDLKTANFIYLRLFILEQLKFQISKAKKTSKKNNFCDIFCNVNSVYGGRKNLIFYRINIEKLQSKPLSA